MIPFFIINGFLTGSWINDPVVWYNDAENLGIRIGTVPIEDSIYALSMLLTIFLLMEKFREKYPLESESYYFLVGKRYTQNSSEIIKVKQNLKILLTPNYGMKSQLFQKKISNGRSFKKLDSGLNQSII